LIDQPDAVDWPASQAAVSTGAVFTPETNLATAMQQVANQNQDWIAVVDGGQHRRFLGIISRAKIVTTYQATLDRIREEEQASA
jgi:non-ribosomal peptide synthetase component E (peptide arylation enzyme)